MTTSESKPTVTLKPKSNVVDTNGDVVEQSFLFSNEVRHHSIIIGKSGAGIKNSTTPNLKLITKE